MTAPLGQSSLVWFAFLPSASSLSSGHSSMCFGGGWPDISATNVFTLLISTGMEQSYTKPGVCMSGFYFADDGCQGGEEPHLEMHAVHGPAHSSLRRMLMLLASCPGGCINSQAQSSMAASKPDRH